MNMKNSAKSKIKVITITKVGVLAAIATILMLFEIPLWFAPSFYKIDLSELPVLLGGFALGPLAGVAIEIIKILLNFVINGTITGGVGELSNFIIGCSLVVPASLIYKYKNNFKGAVISIIIGIVSMTVVGSFMNYILILPMYSQLGLMPMEAIINAGNAVNKNITNLETFVLFAVAPFNLVKGMIVSITTLLLYKRLSKILHK